ncbi:hypothetical protein [Virgibacillus sediminis]|uniref:Cytochrome c oxidase subunit 2A n=1 Tax=Virgibacillus sediminis TaxID=202260 RepID=A0ABV7AAP2_9BACI
MATAKEIKQKANQHETESLKGALFSSVVFVGGGIVLFFLLLFILYMVRL